jgi:hypothetical protein
MRLTFPKFDARGHASENVTDEESGTVVGSISSNAVGFSNYGGIRVSLFQGKCRAELHSYPECVGFVKGVETVLNHVIGSQSKTAGKTEAA